MTHTTSPTAGIQTDTDGIHTGIWECGTVFTTGDGTTLGITAAYTVLGTTEVSITHGIMQGIMTLGTMEDGTIHGIMVTAGTVGMTRSTDICTRITADGMEDGIHTTTIITTITTSHIRHQEQSSTEKCTEDPVLRPPETVFLQEEAHPSHRPEPLPEECRPPAEAHSAPAGQLRQERRQEGDLRLQARHLHVRQPHTEDRQAQHHAFQAAVRRTAEAQALRAAPQLTAEVQVLRAAVRHTAEAILPQADQVTAPVRLAEDIAEAARAVAADTAEAAQEAEDRNSSNLS